MVDVLSFVGGIEGPLAAIQDRIAKSGLSDLQKDELLRWAVYLRISAGLSSCTVGTYIGSVMQFCAWANARQLTLDTISAADGEEWVKHLYLEQRNGAVTRGVKLTGLRRFFDWRERMQKGYNPVRILKGPRRERRMAHKFTSSQLAQMFRACEPAKPVGVRDRALLIFLYATGARRSEVVNLAMHQIELSERVGIVRFFGKGAKERVVSFEGPAVRILREWLTVRDGLDFIVDHDAVWITLSGANKGGRLSRSGLTEVIHRAAQRAGMRRCDVWLHKMRSTFCTDLFDAGLGLEQIQVLMGHEDIETTRRYLAISERQLRARMPAVRLDHLLEPNVHAFPRWARRKLRHRLGEKELSKT